MEQVLVVVESPAKARTIKKYLGDGYKVKASVGHIRDLPEKSLGIDIENDFEPKYIVVKGKRKVIKELKDESSKSSMVYLATDMDREGEAIAWHIKEIVGNSRIPIKRIIFNEITKKALEEAVKSPMDIDINKVNAQQARRILDRLVGYLISPVLWKFFYKGLSAGRVQSVGLRLICEREEEIRHFVPSEYWTIEALFNSAKGEEIVAKLSKVDGKKPDIKDEKSAGEIIEAVKKTTPGVKSVAIKEKLRNPQPPFITSTMQREAANRLGFSAKKTMLIAQQLYEGVELGNEGSVGLISYMRTDSTRISDEAFQRGTEFLRSNYGEDVVNKGRRSYKKTKMAQDAHEAIRPTDCTRRPEEIRRFLNKDQYALYNLIWMRFLASLAAPAVYETIEVDISAGERFTFRANGRRLKKKGFLAVFPDSRAQDLEWLPELKIGEALTLKKIDPTQHFTEPPPRYTEASLIKELEEKGVGRPSTYASILSIIQTRGYVEKQKQTLCPTELGEKVWKTLEMLFTDIFEIGFTARMEEELDKVEEAKENWRDVVRFFYNPLVVNLDHVNERRDEIKKEIEEEVDDVCEICGRKLIKKWGRNGPFLACPAYPECKFTKSLNKVELVGRKCPECGGELVYKNGRFGRFIACSNYPKCKYTEAIKLGIPCPREGCDGEIVEKRTRRGKVFYGCSNYPKCDYASWDKPTGIMCPECSKTYLVEKQSKKKGKYLKCPECGYEEAL